MDNSKIIKILDKIKKDDRYERILELTFEQGFNISFFLKDFKKILEESILYTQEDLFIKDPEDFFNNIKLNLKIESKNKQLIKQISVMPEILLFCSTELKKEIEYNIQEVEVKYFKNSFEKKIYNKDFLNLIKVLSNNKDSFDKRLINYIIKNLSLFNNISNEKKVFTIQESFYNLINNQNIGEEEKNKIFLSFYEQKINNKYYLKEEYRKLPTSLLMKLLEKDNKNIDCNTLIINEILYSNRNIDVKDLNIANKNHLYLDIYEGININNLKIFMDYLQRNNRKFLLSNLEVKVTEDIKNMANASKFNILLPRNSINRKVLSMLNIENHQKFREDLSFYIQFNNSEDPHNYIFKKTLNNDEFKKTYTTEEIINIINYIIIEENNLLSKKIVIPELLLLDLILENNLNSSDIEKIIEKISSKNIRDNIFSLIFISFKESFFEEFSNKFIEEFTLNIDKNKKNFYDTNSLKQKIIENYCKDNNIDIKKYDRIHIKLENYLLKQDITENSILSNKKRL